MAIPDIKFTIVAGGVDKVMTDLKSINKAVEQTYNNIERLSQKTNSQLVKFEAEKTRQILNLHKKMVEGMSRHASEEARRQAAIARQTVDNIEREYRRLQHISVTPGGGMARFGAAPGQHNLGASGAAGMGRGGVRISPRGISGTGFLGFESGMAGIGAGIGVGLFVTAVSTAFREAADVIKTGAQYLASSLVDAATQIGGGKGLGDVFVERANVEHSAARLGALQGVSPKERMTKTEIENAISDVRRGTPFTAEDVTAGIERYQAVSGRVRSAFGVAPEVLRLSRVNKISAEQGFDILGTLAAQHPDLNQNQLMQVMRNLSRLGEAGAVPFSDVSSIGRATGMAGMIGAGNVAGGLGIEYGMVQAAKQGGAPSPTVAVGRLQEYMEKEMGGETAIDVKTGQRFFPNFGRSLANLYEQTAGGTHTLPGMERSRQVLTGIREQVMAEHPGASMAEQKKAVEALVDSWGKLNVTSEELNEEYKQSIDNIKDKLIVSFNDLYETLKTNVGPLFDAFAAQLMEFMKNISPQDLKTATGSLITLFGTLVQALPNIVDAFATLGKIVLMAAKGIWFWAEALSIATPQGWAIRGFTDLGKDLDAMGDVIDKSRDSYDKLSDAAKNAANALNAMSPGGAVKNTALEQVSVPHFFRPAAPTMHAAPSLSGTDRENVKWFRELVKTGIQGNELVKEQNRKLDNMNPPDPSRSGQANK